MTRCIVCGNDYDRMLSIQYEGRRYDFDCFECAIEKLAPRCQHCHCHIIGHGIEEHGSTYCCSHCANHAQELSASSPS